MTEPLSDDVATVRPSRAQTSVRRRAYRRSQAAANGNGSALPDAGPVEAEIDADIEAELGELELLDQVDPEVFEPDEVDDEDLEGGGADPELYDEIDLGVVVAELAPEPEPKVMAPRPSTKRRGKKKLVQARRVRRTIRSIDVLSLGKLAFVFNLCVLVMVLVAGVILWSVASASGSIDNIESFIEDIGFNDFQLRGDELLRGVAVGGFVMAITATGFIILMGVLFNLLSDVVGGVRITMIEPDERSGGAGQA
jgi:hypothetical protein